MKQTKTRFSIKEYLGVLVFVVLVFEVLVFIVLAFEVLVFDFFKSFISSIFNAP